MNIPRDPKSPVRLPPPWTWVTGDPDFVRSWPDGWLEAPERVSGRDLGTVVTDRNSSWVRALNFGATPCHIKTYDYPGRRDRWRGWLRNTFLARSRAHREARALQWLRLSGFAAPEPLAGLEKRRLGWLHRAVLITRTWPGTALDLAWPTLAAADRDEVLAVLSEQVDRLHRAGFRHRNLDPRNILVRREEERAGSMGPWQVAFLDPPRYRLCRPRPPADPPPRDRWALADHDRLSRGLAALGVPWHPRG